VSISALFNALNGLLEAVILPSYYSISDSLWLCSFFTVRNVLIVISAVFSLFLELFGHPLLRLVGGSGIVMLVVGL
jgi:hypothetical protein